MDQTADAPPVPAARLTALLIAALTIAALVAQGIVSQRLLTPAGPLRVIWEMAGYFTVLTNALVAITFARIAATGRRGSAGWHGGLLLWIVTVGLIDHALLARLWSPQGLGWWADQGLHSATPLMVLLWWLAFAPKSPFTRWHPLSWAAYPLAYAAYALLRGAITGLYPYPFIDLATLGPLRTACNIAALTAGFVLGGHILRWLATRLVRLPT
jgi:hypothetical protein